MRASWHALHTSLMRSTQTLTHQTRFETLRRHWPELGRFRDHAALLNFLHCPGGDGAQRNAVLRALVGAAQSSDSASDAPAVLLLLALWPGLDAMYRRLCRHFRSEPDLLVSEISARVLCGIRGLRLDHVTWIAATLIRNAERDIIRDLQRQWRERNEPLQEDEPSYSQPPSHLGLPPGLEGDLATELVAGRLQQHLGADVSLVIAVVLLGERQHEAAARLGIAPEAARKRYQRAMRRLRDGLGEDLSQNAPEPGFSRSTRRIVRPRRRGRSM